MKKFLSLALAITVSSLGLISLPARAARAQEVASAGKSIAEIKEEYERLLAIERDPSTSAEAREMNRGFLEARRAQLADALRKRIGALRKYQSSVATSLSDEERRVVEGSIQQLAAELQALQPARSDPPADASRPARRPSAAARPKQQVPASDGGDAESSAEQPAPDPGARRSRKAEAIEITAPDRDKTVHVGEFEVEVRVNDEDVDDLMVAVYTSASEKPKSARTLEVKRSDKGMKSFPVSLSKGDNRIEVSDLKRPDVKAERVITFAPADSPNIGGAATRTAGTAADSAITLAGNHTCQNGILDITLDAARTAKSPLTVTVTDTTANRVVDTFTVALNFNDLVYHVNVPYIAVGPNRITVTDASGKETAGLDWDGTSCASRGTGHLTGLLLGGLVVSQQAGQFSQADPFMGFNVGYSGKWVGSSRLHAHFQGIFQPEAKKDEAPPKDVAIPDPTDFKAFLASRKAFDIEGQIYADWPLSLGAGPSKQVFIGPYFAWGATTFMDKSELLGDENVKVPNKDLGASATPTPAPTPGGAGSDTTELDTSRAKIDNDLKSYRDLGFIVNIFADSGTASQRPTRQFLQALFAYGRYEGLAGLYNAGPHPSFLKDSRNRFIGKLRIFPTFLLDTNPDSKIPFMPMFGVELNAGRGPDQLKFFTGIAIPVGNAKIKASQAAAQTGGDTGDKKETTDGSDKKTGGGSNP